jgi:hypothetical protein
MEVGCSAAERDREFHAVLGHCGLDYRRFHMMIRQEAQILAQSQPDEPDSAEPGLVRSGTDFAWMRRAFRQRTHVGFLHFTDRQMPAARHEAHTLIQAVGVAGTDHECTDDCVIAPDSVRCTGA